MEDYSLSTLILAAFVVVQTISKWLAIRAEKTKEEHDLYSNLNNMVEGLKKRVRELEASEKRHHAELIILRPLAAQVPLLQSQIKILQDKIETNL